jgi:sugar/nucleoside kinase (ribokinase family)
MNELLFDYIVGTGGIGTGRFFEMEGNHTLGRNESRLALLTDYKDYCKLHIILHYAAVFLKGAVPVYAIGHVGADGEGRFLKAEMAKAGVNVLYVTEDARSPTMYSLCCQYPNGENCNITAKNSACQTVGAQDLDRFFNEVNPKGRGLVVAAPEVPLETRLHMLKKGRRRKCFNVATVLAGEALCFAKQGGAALTDLISLNMNEAQAFAPLNGDNDTDQGIIESCIKYLQLLNPEITIIITLGGKGALIRHGDRFYKSGAADVQVVNTAGAGDCFLGTVIAAKTRGIGLFPPQANNDKLACAIDLGNAASGKKVECKDTIDFSMSVESLEQFAQKHGLFFTDTIQEAFFHSVL